MVYSEFAAIKVFIIGVLTLSQMSVGMNESENAANQASLVRKYVYSCPIKPPSIIANVPDECSDSHEIVKTNLDQIQSYFLTNILIPTKFVKLRLYMIDAEFLSPIVLNVTQRDGVFPILNYNRKNVLRDFIERISRLNSNERENFCAGHLDNDVDDLIDLLGNYVQAGSFLAPSVFAIVLNTVITARKEHSSHPFFSWLFQNYDPHFHGIQTVILKKKRK